MKTRLIYILSFFTLITSCDHSGKQTESAVEDVGISVRDEENIIFSSKQFETAGMRIGDPETFEFDQTVKGNGTISTSPGGRAQINSMIQGRVSDINVVSGSYVQKGETLFTMESNEAIMLQQEYAEVFQQLQVLESDYLRQKALFEDKIASEKDFLKIQSEYNSMLARAEGLKARLKLLGIDARIVGKGKISSEISVVAPVKGYVTNLEIVKGEFADPQTCLMEIVDIDQLQLRINVFEKDLDGMVAGQKVVFYNPNDEDTRYEAILRRTGKSINRESRTVLCIAELKQADKASFIDGQFMETEIITCQRNVKAIPENAVIREGQNNYVLELMQEDEDKYVFRKIPIAVGAIQKGYAEVLDEGLKNLLVEGVYSLNTGE